MNPSLFLAHSTGSIFHHILSISFAISEYGCVSRFFIFDKTFMFCTSSSFSMNLATYSGVVLLSSNAKYLSCNSESYFFFSASVKLKLLSRYFLLSISPMILSALVKSFSYASLFSSCNK